MRDFGVNFPAMTDFRAGGTIMGLAGLTAVFGMGTGGTPPVWSPGRRRRDAFKPRRRRVPDGDRNHARRCEAVAALLRTRDLVVSLASGVSSTAGLDRAMGIMAAAGRGGQAARLLGLVR